MEGDAAVTSGVPGQVSRVSRRDLLRLAGATTVAAAVPFGLAACRPATVPPAPLAPDPSVRPLGFVGGADAVVGPGGWCWFQSPRTSMGPNGVLWLGSSVGTGSAAAGRIQATAFDTRTSKVLARRTVAQHTVDDHTSPSVLTLGDKVQVSWALHEPLDYLDVGDTSLSAPFVDHRIHRPGSIQPPGVGLSYSSAHIVNGQRWILYRGEQFSWNLLTSADGVTWAARGLVIRPRTAGDRPYLVAAGDGKRLWFTVTDGHPTEFPGPTGAYAGVIEPDLRITRSDGTVAGSVGKGAPRPRALTVLAAGVDGPNEASGVDHWLCDLRIVDHRATGVLSRRDRWPAGSASVGQYRHQYLWARQRSTEWVVEPLCWAGGELSASQPDYTGLATQDPTEPTRVVVSANVHPVSGVPLVSNADGLVHFELFEGRRTGEGAWSFTDLTAHSTADNVRPHIAAGGSTKTLSWMRGRYATWKDFDTQIVVRRAVAGPVAPADASPPATFSSPG